MKELRTEITIQAPKEKVWQVLTNTNQYEEWNPFIRKVTGNFQEGSHIQAELHPADKNPMTIRPRVLKVEEHQELRWKGKMLISGIFDGEHIFQLEEMKDNTTRFIHREEFNGVLVPFFKKLLDDHTRRGFEAMNQALKDRCEKRSA